MLFSFTHTSEIDWMLPGVPPTGRKVEVPLIAIVQFRDGKLVHEHIYWDQASFFSCADRQPAGGGRGGSPKGGGQDPAEQCAYAELGEERGPRFSWASELHCWKQFWNWAAKHSQKIFENAWSRSWLHV
jgi:hypothetical protein